MDNAANIAFSRPPVRGKIHSDDRSVPVSPCNSKRFAIVRHAGGAIRMKTSAFREEFRRGGSFQRSSLRYIQALLTQISQRAVCNGLHSIEQRLACWLLMTQDRVGSEKLQVTQEFVSNLLGVCREGVSLTTCSLRNKGVIVCNRGHIIILDRAGLESTACECYRVI